MNGGDVGITSLKGTWRHRPNFSVNRPNNCTLANGIRAIGFKIFDLFYTLKQSSCLILSISNILRKLSSVVVDICKNYLQSFIDMLAASGISSDRTNRTHLNFHRTVATLLANRLICCIDRSQLGFLHLLYL